MKRKITLLIALVVSIILALLTSSDQAVNAQQVKRFRADTGLVTLGPNQVLRLSIAGDFNPDGDVDGADFLAVFRRMGYIEQGNIYKVSSQNTFAPIALSGSEGTSIDISPGNFAAVRGVVMSSRRNVRASASIINSVTGEVTSQIIIANTEGDVH